MNIKKSVIPILSVCCVISVVFMIFVLCIKASDNKTKEFIPPAFEVNAKTELPTIPSDLNWSEIQNDGMSFKIGICGNIIIKDNNQFDIYLLNNKQNDVWIKLRILDDKDSIIGETGLLRQGEYIQSVDLNRNVSIGEHIKLKIMSYQPDTYYSEGAIVLNTIIKGEG